MVPIKKDVTTIDESIHCKYKKNPIQQSGNREYKAVCADTKNSNWFRFHFAALVYL